METEITSREILTDVASATGTAHSLPEIVFLLSHHRKPVIGVRDALTRVGGAVCKTSWRQITATGQQKPNWLSDKPEPSQSTATDPIATLSPDLPHRGAGFLSGERSYLRNSLRDGSGVRFSPRPEGSAVRKLTKAAKL
jgi:hypothetical protein